MTIVPIKELKNTAAISEKCHELNEPVFVTKNGYGDMAIMSMETFQRYDEVVREAKAAQEARRAWFGETVDLLRKAHTEAERGELLDADELFAEYEARYGL